MKNVVAQGIDVSKWQGRINWELVKKAGVQFAILRAGYGDSLNNPNQLDEEFERNYAECKRLGIPVGVYWYSYAVTVDMAIQEAKSCYEAIKGKQFEYPLYYDVEEQRIFNTGLTNEIGKAFFDYMESKDYWVGWYTFRSAVTNYLTPRMRERYAMAIAEYGNELHYDGQYGIWQYSSTGKVNGIMGNVDLDYCYVDYPTMIKGKGKNGYKKSNLKYEVVKDTPRVVLGDIEKKGTTVTVYGRKTICGVQYGRVNSTEWISLKDCREKG